MKDYRIETTFAVGLVTVMNKRVVKAPPIYHWMVGKFLSKIIESLKEGKHFVSLIEI